MFNSLKNLVLVVAFSFFAFQAFSQDSRQLISSTTKTFKVHFGIETGLGVSHLLAKPYAIQPLVLSQDETTILPVEQYDIMLAPRGEARFGFFTEYEAPSGWGMKSSVGYMGKALPKPVENTSANIPYNVGYLNNLTYAFSFYFKPMGKVRLGLGTEYHWAFRTGKQRRVGTVGDYWESLTTYMGLRGEVSYQVNPRTFINTYIGLGSHFAANVPVDYISGGVTVAYRLKGKEYEIKKDIYRINYESVEMPKKAKKKMPKMNSIK